jgi:hypothetical protein
MGTGFHHLNNQDTVKDLPSAVLVSLLELSVDVLRRYSLPNMDLRIATYFIIALLPKHETTSVDVGFKVPVRPPFRRCLAQVQPPPGSPISGRFRSTLTVLKRLVFVMK